MGKILTVKVNKGGVGKTFLTTQIGMGLSSLGNKVLLLTSDSQNNILDYTFSVDKKPSFHDGLKAYVRDGGGELIKLRENLYFIPLEDVKFSTQFLSELPNALSNLKKEYDYIIIDSIPTMKLDSVFVECSDHVIVPCFADRTTVEGAVNVIQEAGIEKIHSIILNKFKKTKNQVYYYNELKSILEGTGILFPKPISELSQIENILEKGKTIFEYNNKTIKQVQESIIDIIANI